MTSTGGVRRTELELPDGRALGIHDTGPDAGASVVLWHGGSPNTGEPPAPWRDDGERWIGVDRPGYGRSTRLPGRRVADVTTDVGAVLDHLGIATCRTVGHSGGASHALACAALLPDRVTAALCLSGLSPGDPLEAPDTGDEIPFTPEDRAVLAGPWAWFETVVAEASGSPGFDDDELAHAGDWGFDPAVTTVPVRIVHGEADLVVPIGHAYRLARLLPAAELVVVPGAGHLSVLEHLDARGGLTRGAG
ncbi:alpha/beta fold hydrolase [Kineococcus sp. TBRC 1896]|uniref:Alpha/beta fold hydrolase n=1 Tax=Kineococcus mangrovi TaxID=1660183 RepID=A0ABV4HZC6_9ACTN